MIIDCISDLHGYYPHLTGGDLLIVAGDLTKNDTKKQIFEYIKWLCNQDYEKKIHIGGNHDNSLVPQSTDSYGAKGNSYNIDYLRDTDTEFKGLKIWGSPWTKTFKGINPKCCAFTIGTDEELNEKWKLIPDDIDILITHCPPYTVLDEVRADHYTTPSEHVGSQSLLDHVTNRIKPKVHVFGHIHERGGRKIDTDTTKFVNASIVNEHYKHVNKPVRIEL